MKKRWTQIPSIFLFWTSMHIDKNNCQLISLFLFCHQDDEFGVFQSIHDDLKFGYKVYCIYMTDGSFGGNDPEERNKETLRVLNDIGVFKENVIFAGSNMSIPDANLAMHITGAADWLYRWLTVNRNIERIYIPAWEGGHHDHDALHAIAVCVTKKLNILRIVRQFPLYNGEGLRGPFFRVLAPYSNNGIVSTKNIPWKKRIQYIKYCFWYPSQTKTWIGLFPYVTLHYLLGKGQSFQTASFDRILQRPHTGPLYYERRFSFSWERLRKAVLDLQNHLENITRAFE